MLLPSAASASFRHDASYVPVELQFKELGFVVHDRASRSAKRILSGVSGSCVPGRLFAIMGPSGAGAGGHGASYTGDSTCTVHSVGANGLF